MSRSSEDGAKEMVRVCRIRMPVLLGFSNANALM